MKNLLLCLIAMVAVAACTVEKTMEPESSMLLLKTRSIASLEVDAQFLKLEDDTVSFVAGELEIDAPGNEVAVKWNILPGCNLDTMVVSLPVENGKAHLDIKWNNCLRRHHHGPDSLAFEAGVIISTEDKAKYVRLLWADAIDSLYFAQNPVVMDTPQSPYPEPKAFIVDPLVLNLQEVIGGSIMVSSGNGIGSAVDLTEITADMNINMEGVIPDPSSPGVVKDGGYLVFQWTAVGPPLFSFTVPINIRNSNKTITAYIVYKHKDVPPPFFQLISALPNANGVISAKNGYVMVTVETNKAWSIVSDCSDEVIEDTDESGLKTRAQMIHILDNPNPNRRLVHVIIKSQGVPKDTIDIFQLGTEEITGLNYFKDNMPPSLPKVGGEYTFTFVGVNPGTVQVQALVDGVSISVGTAVAGLEAKVTVPENPNTTDRNVTFQFKVTGGGWTPLPIQTNRVQLGSNGGEVDALTYVDSNLLAGNIPQLGDTYTFNFKGTYKGRLRVRVLIDGTSYLGDMAANLSPTVTVPANATTSIRAVRFQYRPFDADAALNKWTNLPDNTKRNQDALTTSGTIDSAILTPDDPISEYGGKYTCNFVGSYTGTIVMRAIVGNEVLVKNTGYMDGVSVMVPQLFGSNRTVIFQYSMDGENTWVTVGTRQQLNESLSVTVDGKVPTLPAVNANMSYNITGTYTKSVTVYASYNQVVVGQATASNIPQKLVVPVGDNATGVSRNLYFYYIRSGDGKKFVIGYITQLGQ